MTFEDAQQVVGNKLRKLEVATIENGKHLERIADALEALAREHAGRSYWELKQDKAEVPSEAELQLGENDDG